MPDTVAPAAPGTTTAPAAPAPANPTPATPVAPAAPTSIADAGAALKKAASWDETPFPDVAGGMAVTDGETVDGTPVTDPAPATDPAADGPEFVQDEHGKWHRGASDGTFASAEEIAQIEAQLAADTKAAPAKADEAKPDETPKASTVTLRRRDGTTREVEIDDPELADEIRTNYNDGMRRRDYTEKVAVVDAKLAQLNRIDAMLDKNPAAFVAHSLTKEQKIQLGTQILAEHFEELVPIIQKYDTNQASRIADTAQAQARLREQETEFRTFEQAQKQAADVKQAIAALIPDTLDEETTRLFWQDASADLTSAISRGEKVDSTTVAKQLQRRMSLYGFTAPVGGTPASAKPRITALPPSNAPAQPSTTPAAPVAQPANDAAKQLADAKATQRRIKLTQRNRSIAAAVPPVGAGAAPVRLPPVPPGASIEEASKALKKMRSWTS